MPIEQFAPELSKIISTDEPILELADGFGEGHQTFAVALVPGLGPGLLKCLNEFFFCLLLRASELNRAELAAFECKLAACESELAACKSNLATCESRLATCESAHATTLQRWSVAVRCASARSFSIARMRSRA